MRTTRLILALALLAMARPSLGQEAVIVRQRILVAGAAEEPRDQTQYYAGALRISEDDRFRSIINLDRKTLTTINKKKQTYSVVTFEQLAAREDKHDNRVKDLPAPVRGMIHADEQIVLRPTGKHETIAGYETEEVVVEGKGVAGKVWVTKAIDFGPRAKEWSKVTSLFGAGSSPGGKLDQALAEQKSVALRRDLTMPPLPPVTTEVLEIRRAPLDKAVTGIPEGFSKVDPPKRR